MRDELAEMTIRDLDQVLGQTGGEARFHSTTIQATAACVDRADEAATVAALLAEAGEGWICTGGGVYRLRVGRALECVSGDPLPIKAGELLSAELCLRGGGSVHLRRNGAALYVHTLREGEREGGQAALAEDRSFVSTEGASGRLHYRVYWTLSEETSGGVPVQIWRQTHARFCGLE